MTPCRRYRSVSGQSVSGQSRERHRVRRGGFRTIGRGTGYDEAIGRFYSSRAVSLSFPGCFFLRLNRTPRPAGPRTRRSAVHPGFRRRGDWRVSAFKIPRSGQGSGAAGPQGVRLQKKKRQVPTPSGSRVSALENTAAPSARLR